MRAVHRRTERNTTNVCLRLVVHTTKQLKDDAEHSRTSPDTCQCAFFDRGTPLPPRRSKERSVNSKKEKRKDQRSMLRVQLRLDSKECTVVALQREILVDGRWDGRANQQYSGSSFSLFTQFLLHFVASSACVDSRHVCGARLPCRTSLQNVRHPRHHEQLW